MAEVCFNHAPVGWRENVKLWAEVLDDILSLNGKPSIHQINRFCERLRALDPSPSADLLLEEYLVLLRRTVADRMQSASSNADPFLIQGSKKVLTLLRDRGFKLIILSGTLESDVKREAELLGLKDFFGEHIYGAPITGSFSKLDVFLRILRQESIEGRHLLAFGDGPVEMEFAKSIGALAIGIASDERDNRSRRIDPIKRKHLVAAGADAIIPDYIDAEELLRQIFG